MSHPARHHLAAAAALAAGAWVTSRVLRRPHETLLGPDMAQAIGRSPHRDGTGGCDPDTGYWFDAPLFIPDINGTHQGLALAHLRTTCYDTPASELAADEVETSAQLPALDDTIDVDYEELVRSYVEISIALVLILADRNHSTTITCPRGECEAAPSGQLLTMFAARMAATVARTYDTAAHEHATECGECRRAGATAPLALRARYMRDICDTMLIDPHTDQVVVRGTTIEALSSVTQTMIETLAKDRQVEPVEVLAQLDQGLASALLATYLDGTADPI